jgi:RHS repeat-associated protein
VTYKKSQVVQSNNYYAFGMQTSESWTRTGTQPNKYLYNGGSELNGSTGNYEMFFREYDPALGRMNAVDPMASKYASLTPYNYAFNDPVTLNDPTGADPYYQDVPGYQNYPYWTGYVNGQYYVTDNLPQRDRGEAVYNDMSRVYRGGDPYGIARSAQLWSTMQQMRADAYNLSAEEYGYKYGQAISMSTFFGYVASYNKASLIEIALASIRVRGMDKISPPKKPSAGNTLLASAGGGASYMLAQQGTLIPNPASIMNEYPDPLGEYCSQAYNECAIRMSIALGKNEVDISDSDKFRKTHKGGGVVHQPSAAALADWLSQSGQLGPPKIYTHPTGDWSKSDFINKEGIIYFAHPHRGGTGPGHIDIISNGKIGSGFYDNKIIWFWEYINGSYVSN